MFAPFELVQANWYVCKYSSTSGWINTTQKPHRGCASIVELAKNSFIIIIILIGIISAIRKRFDNVDSVTFCVGFKPRHSVPTLWASGLANVLLDTSRSIEYWGLINHFVMYKTETQRKKDDALHVNLQPSLGSMWFKTYPAYGPFQCTTRCFHAVFFFLCVPISVVKQQRSTYCSSLLLCVPLNPIFIFFLEK